MAAEAWVVARAAVGVVAAQRRLQAEPAAPALLLAAGAQGLGAGLHTSPKPAQRRQAREGEVAVCVIWFVCIIKLL